MLHALLLATVLSDTDLAVTELKSRVVSAAVLKQGLALVVREVVVPGKGRKFKLDAWPDALDGSFWYGSPDGVVIGDVQTKLRFKEASGRVAHSIAELLAANVGKRMHFFITTDQYTPKPQKEEIYATLETFPPPNQEPATFKMDDGFLRAIPIASIRKLDPKGLSVKGAPSQMPVQQIDFEVDPGKSGRVDFITLENTAAWTGSYLVNLQDQSTASVVSKAQLAVGGLKLDNTKVQVVSGSPVMPDVVKFDLASGFGSLNAYLKDNQEAYRRYRIVNRDPYTLIPSLFDRQSNFNQSAYSSGSFANSYGGVGGGLGGGGLGGFAPTDELQMPYSPQPRQTTNPEQVEDLFGFPLGVVSMEPGDRLSRVMFRTQSSYDRLYRWTLVRRRAYLNQPAVKTDKVAKLIKIKNTSDVPWPSGSALIVENGTPLAQVVMPFTSKGKIAPIEIGKADDIPISEKVREITREPIRIRSFDYTLVTNEETLTVENTRSDELPFEIVFEGSGTVLDAGGGTLELVGSNLDELDTFSRLTWSFKLKPGEIKTFVMKYKTII